MICNSCIFKLAITCCVICIIMNLKKLLDSGKSVKKNSSGPKMEPCGTPVTIDNVLDAVSFNSINCSLFAR